jgi:hypothetical protein
MPQRIEAIDPDGIEFFRVSKALRANPPVECAEETDTAIKLALWASNPTVRAGAKRLLDDRFGLLLQPPGSA